MIESIPLEEQETTCTLSRTSKTFRLYTSDRTVMTKLDKLVERCPQDVKVIKSDAVSKWYELPRTFFKISPKRTVVMTDERRRAMSERMASMRKNG